ncbi:hypothetical protein [Armatimonas sp.]|uniref:hypothetical protein n=1 Tax=Armatimonas sp. TaxID=1872638 RepID=UPI0037513B81
MRLVSRESGRVLATDARWLGSFWARGRGWLARPSDPTVALGIPLTEGERLHTIGMRFALTLAYCDSQGCVLCVLTLPPFRIAPRVPGATVAWELVAGGLEGVAVGETLACD